MSRKARTHDTVHDVADREVLIFPKKFVNGNDYVIFTGKQLGAKGVHFYHISGKKCTSGKRISQTGDLLFLK